MSPAWADILLFLSFAAIATLISGLIFSLRRDTPSPRQFGWLIMAIVAVLAVQVIVTVTIFVASPAPTPAPIPVPAESSGDHQAILDAIRDLRVPVAKDPEPPVVTSRGWLVFTLLAVLGIAIVIVGPRLLRRFFPSSEVVPVAATAAGSLLTLPLALSGSITLVDQLNLVDNFAFLKVEIGEPSDVDERLIDEAVRKALQEQWNNIAQTLANSRDDIARHVTYSLGDTERAIALKIDATHTLSPSTGEPSTHVEQGLIYCGNNREMFVADFETRAAIDSEKPVLAAKIRRIADILGASKDGQYLGSVLLIGSADRRRLSTSNDQLAIQRAEWVGTELARAVGGGPQFVNISRKVPGLRVSVNDGRESERGVQVCGLWLDRKESAELAGTAPTQP